MQIVNHYNAMLKAPHECDHGGGRNPKGDRERERERERERDATWKPLNGWSKGQNSKV